jgi:hypothetical protein
MSSLLAEAELLDAFEPALLLFSSVEGIDKSQKQFFVLATQRADVPFTSAKVKQSAKSLHLQSSALRIIRCMFFMSST